MTKLELKPEFKEIGLGKKDITQVFLAKARGLQSQWEHLTPDQRLAKIKIIINDTYSSAGFPQVKVEKRDIPKEIEEVQGLFSNSTCSIFLNKKLIQEDRIEDSQMTRLAKCIYHEMRHGEQYYRGIQVLAENLKVSSKEAEKIQELANQHEIENIEFVTHAIRAGEINQLSATEAEFARVMCEVLFGEYRQYIDAEKRDYIESLFDFTEARDEYMDALGDLNTPREQKEALKSKFDKSLNEFEEKQENNRKTYKNDLAEIDARDIADVLIPSFVPVQTAQVAESSGIQAGESSTQQVQDDEIRSAPRTPRRVSLTASPTQAGADPGERSEEIEMEEPGVPRLVGAPTPRSRPRRSTNPISECLPCFGRSRRSDSRSSGRSRSQSDRRTR
jgi:hypothetical protein